MSVSDTGPGIPKDKFDNLFKPFDRLGMEGLNIEGAGIAQAIVKRLVELMGGEIGVESKVCKGSTLYIDLPVGKKPESATAKSVTASTEPAFIDKGRTGTVCTSKATKRVLSW